MEQSERLLNITEAARLLGVHANTLRGWADRGLVKAIRLPSGHRRFTPAEIDRIRLEMGFDETEGKLAA